MADEGLFNKYEVRRTDLRDLAGAKHEDCFLFVLDLTHDDLALKTAWHYADLARSDGQIKLANDLERRILIEERKRR